MALEEIKGPDANGMYTRYIDGQPVETWSGTDALQTQGVVGPTSNTTLIDTRGNVVPAGTAPEAPASGSAPQATPTSAPATAGSGTSPHAPSGARNDPYARGGGGYQPGADSAYTGMGALGGASRGAFADDPFASVPSYQAGSAGFQGGQLHPAAGGAPLTPGGVFNQQAAEGEVDTRRQMTQYDTGASAGPFGVQSPKMDMGPMDRRTWDESGRRYADRGTHTSPLYDTFAAKGQAMESKVRGMAGNIQGKLEGGGGTSSAAPSSSAAYAQQGKRMDRAYDRYNEALYNPDPMPVKGWSKKQGFKPGTIDAALGDPTQLLTSVFPGYESRDAPYYDAMESLPMTDLALIRGGTQNKTGLTSKTPVVKVPNVLRQQGVKPVKPENKRTLDSSKVANKVATMYRDLGTPGGDTGWMDQDALLGNLATSKKGSILRQGLQSQFETDPASALQSASSYVRSALSAGPDTVVQRALVEDVDRQFTNQGRDLLRMKPKRASRIVNDVARAYLG
jgi:hypothetical protein